MKQRLEAIVPPPSPPWESSRQYHRVNERPDLAFDVESFFSSTAYLSQIFISHNDIIIISYLFLSSYVSAQ